MTSLTNFIILYVIILFACQSSFAGGYIAADTIHKNSEIAKEEATYLIVWFVIFIAYYLLKMKNNKFVNDNENIILLIIFLIVPVILSMFFIFYSR